MQNAEVTRGETCFLEVFFVDVISVLADVISVHNGNMKHARTIEFDYTNLLAML